MVLEAAKIFGNGRLNVYSAVRVFRTVWQIGLHKIHICVKNS